MSAPYALFVRLARPIDFAAIDSRPVDLAVLLLTPANAGNEHLAILAAISRLMRDEELDRQLRRASDAATVQALLSRA